MSPASFLPRLLGRSRAGVGRNTQHLVSLCEALLGERGEISGAALARQALAAYLGLDERGREEFFDTLAQEFAPSPEAVGKAADAYRYDPTPQNLIQLQEVIDTARQELFRRLNMAPGGTQALVEMRRQLLRGLKKHPAWKAIDADLLHLFRSWFNRGFLRLERIDWRTSAIVLEKLIQYEAVHAVQGWRDLSAQVQPLLDVDSQVAVPEQADCAIFYSITNCQEGLRGTSFGNLLIKQVAEDLKREFPHLRSFATLSPIPGFRRWLAQTETRVQLSLGPNAEQRLALLSTIDQPGWHSGAVPEVLQK